MGRNLNIEPQNLDETPYTHGLSPKQLLGVKLGWRVYKETVGLEAGVGNEKTVNCVRDDCLEIYSRARSVIGRRLDQGLSPKEISVELEKKFGIK